MPEYRLLRQHILSLLQKIGGIIIIGSNWYLSTKFFYTTRLCSAHQHRLKTGPRQMHSRDAASRTLALVSAADQSFEVGSLWKREGNRMVRALGKVTDDLRFPAGVQRGSEDDLLKQIG